MNVYFISSITKQIRFTRQQSVAGMRTKWAWKFSGFVVLAMIIWSLETSWFQNSKNRFSFVGLAPEKKQLQKNVLSHRPTLTPLQRLLLMIRSQSHAMKIPWPCCILKNIFNRRFLFVAIVLFLLFLPNGRLEKLVQTPVVTLNATFFQKLQPSCPKLYPQIFADQAPKGKFGSDESSITLTRNKDATNVEDCVASCCTNLNCQMVFMYKNNSLINCYHVSSFLI